MSPCSTDPFNYACNLGVHSVAAAIIFAVLYIPLFLWFIGQAIVRPTYVYIVLSFFCSIRIAAFTTRAVLAASAHAGENEGFFIASSVLFSVGFFGLLYSTYTLVLDRDLILNPSKEVRLLTRLTRNRHLFRLALTAAVTIGIIGSVDTFSTNESTSNLGRNLHRASAIVFLVLVILLVLQILRIARYEARSDQAPTETLKTFGGRRGTHILMIISLLLLTREVFFEVTVNKTTSEKLWYPLTALTELLAVILLGIPGLVPPRTELPT